MKKIGRQKIERKLPPVGTILRGTFLKKKYVAEIVTDRTTPTGKAIEFAAKKYVSMTAAAKAITKQSTNGWRFWKF